MSMSLRKILLEKCINERLLKENQYLIEGIDIDLENKTVSFNSTHENNVDTSTLINPTYYKLNSIDVISIFKRKKTKYFQLDGNPLIYALKGINNWKFKNSEQDIVNLLKQFIRISEKIKSSYDTIIIVPSNNSLNVNFLYRLNKIIKTQYQITDYFDKMTVEDVFENFINWKKIKEDFKDKYDDIVKSLSICFNSMDTKNNHYFSYKYIKDVNLRKYITRTIHSSNEKTIDYAIHINDKNILILDDTIASGSTISEVCKEISETFTPKSITVITLFSKL